MFKRHTWEKIFKLPWEKIACCAKYKDEFQKSAGILKSFKIDKTMKEYGAYVSKFAIFVSMNPIDIGCKAIRMFEGADEYVKFKSRCEQFEFKNEKLDCSGKQDNVYAIDLKSSKRVSRESYGTIPLIWGELKTENRDELSFELKEKVAFRFVCITLIGSNKNSDKNIDCFPFLFSGNYLSKADNSQLKEYESGDEGAKEGERKKKKKRKGMKVISDSDSSSSESDSEDEKKRKEEEKKKAQEAPKPQTPPGPKVKVIPIYIFLAEGEVRLR